MTTSFNRSAIYINTTGNNNIVALRTIQFHKHYDKCNNPTKTSNNDKCKSENVNDSDVMLKASRKWTVIYYYLKATYM